MRIAIYARVSTDTKDKEKQRQDPETQLLPLQEYCQSRNWQIAQTYVDDVSAVKFRPNFEQMLRDAVMHKFDCIVAVKIDRVARSMKDFVYIMQKLDSAGVRFIAITQGIDTDKSNPASRLQMNIIAAMAEFERDLISERVKAGIARVKRQGKPFGGRPRVVVDIMRIDVLNSQGYSIREIARRLDVSRGTVYQRLKELRKEKENG